MKNSEIKALFVKANQQIRVNVVRKQQTYEAMAAQIDKKRIPFMPKKSILLSQLLYIDKLFFAIYGIIICLGLALILLLQHTGVGKNEMIIACMIGMGILSILSISFIDRLFFGRMAELGASCYFHTKQCVAAYLTLASIINLVLFVLIALYMGCYWKVGLLQVGLYVLTPYFISSVIALGILSTEQGGRTPYVSGICTVFLSIGYAVICSIPGVFFVTALWIWGIAFAVAGILFVMQLKRLFRQMDKGEMLCMN